MIKPVKQEAIAVNPAGSLTRVRLLLGAALIFLLAPAAGAGASLTANGEPEEVTVTVGDTVTFEVTADNCSGITADMWRDTWIFGDGTDEQAIFGTSPCQDSPFTNTHTYTTPGTYQPEFISEYCVDRRGNSSNCRAPGWQEFDRDDVTVIVEPPEPDPIYEYRFDEKTWDGSSGEVEDHSGNDLDGTSAGAVTSKLEPARPGDPGTCRYGVFEAGDRVTGPASELVNDADSFTIATWVRMTRADQVSDFPALMAYGDTQGDDFAERFELYIRRNVSPEQFVFSLRRPNGQIRQFEVDIDTGSATDPLDDNWVHVAVTYNEGNRQVRLYLNGDMAAEDTLQGPAGLADATGGLGLMAHSGGAFDAVGNMDEPRVLTEALTEAQVGTLFDETRPCNFLADFAIDVPNTASVCAGADITVTAVDVRGDPVLDYDNAVNLSTSSGRGDWSLLVGNGVLNNGTANDGSASYDYHIDDDGSAGFKLENSSADDLTVMVEDPVEGIANTSTVISFVENAFEIVANDSLDNEVVAGRDHDFLVRALRQDPDSGECGLNANYDGDIGLKAWLDRHANDPGGQAPAFAGTALPDSQPGSNNITLSFASGEAPAVMETTDVGRFRVELLDDSSGIVVDENDDPIPVLGSSDSLTVRPFGFAIHDIEMNGTANPGGTTPTSAIFGAAGEAFSASVMAVQHQPAHDADDDGVPDADTVLDPVDPTSAFAADGQLDRMVAGGTFEPAEGSVGTLSNGGFVAADFSGGEAQLAGLRYSEVGAVTLHTNLSDYLTAGISVTGRSNIVGRFIADRLQVDVVEEGSLATGCDIEFSYLREDLAYHEPPRIRITPVNANGQHTENYARFSGENWWRLPAIDPAYDDEAIPSAVAGDLLVDPEMADHVPETDQPQNDANGDNNRLLLELEGTLAYKFATGTAPEVTPFDADFRMYIDLIDPDGVQYNNPDDDSETYIHEIAFNESAEQRHGRLNIGNAHGSELLDLHGEVITQYYNGTNEGWILNDDDVCTGNDTVSDIALEASQIQEPVTGNDTCIIEGGNESGMGCNGSSDASKDWSEPPTDGDFNVWFRAPAGALTGSLEIAPTDMPAWLQYDWDGDGTAHDEQPSGVITFGIYEGSDRRIDLRETW